MIILVGINEIMRKILGMGLIIILPKSLQIFFLIVLILERTMFIIWVKWLIPGNMNIMTVFFEWWSPLFIWNLGIYNVFTFIVLWELHVIFKIRKKIRHKKKFTNYYGVFCMVLGFTISVGINFSTSVLQCAKMSASHIIITLGGFLKIFSGTKLILMS